MRSFTTVALRALVACALTAGLAACSSDTSTISGGGGGGDTGGADAGAGDASTGDIGGFDDTGATDSGPTDTGGDDTSEDTGGEDTGGVEDTGGGPAICGNGILEGAEACDDGNNFPGDGCNANCTSDETCGNGYRDLTEECDDGNTSNDDGCASDCTLETGCGNGEVERGEQCDDGNTASGDGCSSECQREVYIAVDTDGDTIADFDEGDGAVDSDGDGTTDELDEDSDNDGIPDSEEAGDAVLSTLPVDTDGDGLPDFRDTDADGDGIDDAVEGAEDVDGDGTGNFADTDSDGDYIPDDVEGVVDTDGDGTPDYVDRDSDGDTILDEHELFADSDGDGTQNRLDLDSDNDGIPDSIEAGDSSLASYPRDFEGDGQPDYIDLDSDGDGLGDGTEVGCAAGSSERLDVDSDDDGFNDLAEFLVGSDPCRTTSEAEFSTFTDFFFTLPEGGPEEREPLEFSSNIRQADIAINMDTTGSMGGEISTLRSSLSGSIVPGIRSTIPNSAFAVTRFDDFPCNGHGGGSDIPFALLQRVTTNVSAAQTAVGRLVASGGADYYESGYESMYQIATGEGVRTCGANIPAFNPAAGRVAGVADGEIGGVGFREGSFPVIIHITDAPSHDAGAYGGGAHSRAQAVARLQGIQARLIGVASGSDPRGQLEGVARDTGATVRPCAWDGARPGGCGAGQCCTAASGRGRGTDGSGMCPLVFDISGSGGGLNTAVVTAVNALANTTTFTITTNLRRDEDEFAVSGIDTTCFITSITPVRAEASGSCSTTPRIVGDRFEDVTPGTALFFDVVAQNDVCVEATDEPQAFNAFIDVIGDDLTVLDTQTVTIIVPAAIENPSTVP